MKRAGYAPDDRQRGFEAAQGLHQPYQREGVHQQRQGQAHLAAVRQKPNTGADGGKRKQHKALIQMKLHEIIVPPPAAGRDQDQHIQVAERPHQLRGAGRLYGAIRRGTLFCGLRSGCGVFFLFLVGHNEPPSRQYVRQRAAGLPCRILFNCTAFGLLFQ